MKFSKLIFFKFYYFCGSLGWGLGNGYFYFSLRTLGENLFFPGVGGLKITTKFK